MTYPPPGNPDPYGQQQPSPDPFATPPAYDPTAPPPPPPPAYDPYGQRPVSPPSSPFTPPPVPQNPYDPYAQQQPYSPAPQPQYGQPYGTPPPYPYGPQMADPNKQNGLAIGAMVTGIASIILGCCCWPVGLLAGVAGGVMGFVARKQIEERGGQGNGMALAGIITGGVGVLLGILGLILAVTGVNQNLINDILNNSGSSLY